MSSRNVDLSLNLFLYSQRVVHSKLFEHAVTALIVATALLVGLETSTSLTDVQRLYIEVGHALLLGLFILEIALRLLAHKTSLGEFFRDPWNTFDVVIATLSLLPWEGDYAIVGRLLRLLRVIRLVARFGELRVIVGTLLKSLPSMGHILVLLSLIYYVYAVMGYHTLRATDPEHFGSIGTAMLTLFRIMTLEDWSDLMYAAMQELPYSWLYFVSFVVMTTFIVINMFIALVLNNLSEIKREMRTNDQARAVEIAAANTDADATIAIMRAHVAAYDRLQHQERSAVGSTPIPINPTT